MSIYKAVIFDFGGVFTTSPLERFAEYELANKLPKKFLGEVTKSNHHNNSWAKYERSEITQEQFNLEFAAETRAAGHEVMGDSLISLLVLKMKPEMIDAHKHIKARGFKTGCITNNLPNMDSTEMLGSSEQGAMAREAMKAFDVVIESSKVGIRKPEPQIYQLMCEKLDVQLSDCIFLDDLGINLKPARKLGMTTIKVPLGDVTPAIDELLELLS